MVLAVKRRHGFYRVAIQQQWYRTALSVASAPDGGIALGGRDRGLSGGGGVGAEL